MTDVAASAAFSPLDEAAGRSAPLAGLAPRAALLRDLVRYGLCSALALAVDWGLLVSLVHVGIAPLPAAASGFLVGMAVAYGLSRWLVFADRRGRSLWSEACGFAAVGFAGLLVNEALLWFLMSTFTMSPGLAKAPTAGVVFLFNFGLRRMLVFVEPGR